MYGIFNQSKPPQETEQPASPMQERMMEVIDQYSGNIPLTVRPMLSGLLHGLKGKMTDDKIGFFIDHTRQLLDYVENGVPLDESPLPFTDIEEGDPDDSDQER